MIEISMMRFATPLTLAFIILALGPIDVALGQLCAAGCYDHWIGDNYCDSVCNNAACNFDGNDCGGSSSGGDCAPGCPSYYMGDYYCDDVCNNAACDFDGNDCGDSSSGGSPAEECSPGCDYDWLGDGTCDSECNNEPCNFDTLYGQEDCKDPIVLSPDNPLQECQEDWDCADYG